MDLAGVSLRHPTTGCEMHDSIRACEAELADLSARVAFATNSVGGSSGGNRGQRSLTLAESGVSTRLDRITRKLDALERRVGPQYATERRLFLRQADLVYDEIQTFIGLPRLNVQLRGMQDAKEEVDDRETAAHEDAEPWSPSCAQRDPSLSALTSKYEQNGAARPRHAVACPATSVTELASKYALQRVGRVDSETATMEETTLELKSQLIFSALNRKPGQRSSRPASIPPEPVKELEDLPTFGALPAV